MILLDECWIICPCGKRHRLSPGIDAPFYWCGDVVKVLDIGDTIYFKEREDETVIINAQ